jgi:hypothetical protein
MGKWNGVTMIIVFLYPMSCLLPYSLIIPLSFANAIHLAYNVDAAACWCDAYSVCRFTFDDTPYQCRLVTFGRFVWILKGFGCGMRLSRIRYAEFVGGVAPASSPLYALLCIVGNSCTSHLGHYCTSEEHVA